MANQDTDFTLDPSVLENLGAPVNRPNDYQLAKRLEERGLIGDDEIRAAMALIQNEGATSLKEALLASHFVTEEDIAQVAESSIGMDSGIERIDLGQVNFTERLLDELTPEQAKRYHVVPVKATKTDLWVAISDPNNIGALDELTLRLGKNIHFFVAGEGAIDVAIREHYEEDKVADVYREMAEAENPMAGTDYDDVLKMQLNGDADTADIVRFVNMMFRQAVYDRASDIHLEPTRGAMTIRVRIDGVLQELPSPPRMWTNGIISLLKVMAGLDLAEKRIPLDGRIKLQIPEKKLDLRVSSLPTIYGESIVMRILDQSSVMMGLEDVGFLPRTVKAFNDLIRRPNGIILMTGPTGSGKTTTLYAALGVLNRPDMKLMTLEDPIEYMIAGINQVQIDHEIGLNFGTGLRGLLRQSPDVILVGEIRDLETAENAIRAALTGHLVFSTLHTNDAPSATVRLADMGVKPYLVASSVQAVLAQRLVRRICTNCKVAYPMKPDEVKMMGFQPEDYEGRIFHTGKGCKRCGNNGYRGRTAIHEVFTVDAELRRRIIRCEASTRLKRYAISQGMQTLRMDGWEKILMGETSVDAVFRVVGGED